MTTIFLQGRRAGKTEAMRTAHQNNAEACQRDCRVVGPGCDWPTCNCPVRAQGSLKDMLCGWQTGIVPPRVPGAYDRLSLLGVWTDMWDGYVWRRQVTSASGHRVDGDHKNNNHPFHGVVCANQDLPWRVVRDVLAHAGNWDRRAA